MSLSTAYYLTFTSTSDVPPVENDGDDSSPKTTTTLTKTAAGAEEGEQDDEDAAKDIRGAIYIPGNEDYILFSGAGK